MADETNIVLGIATGMTAAATGFIGFIGRRFISKVDATEARLAQHEKDDIGKYATVEQLTRVHDRIDKAVQATEEGFRETRNGIGEIKTLLIQGAHK